MLKLYTHKMNEIEKPSQLSKKDRVNDDLIKKLTNRVQKAYTMDQAVN